MENIIFRAFGIIFKTVGILVLTGIFMSALLDIQNKALGSKRRGLTSMLKINEQLVGKAR